MSDISPDLAGRFIAAICHLVAVKTGYWPKREMDPETRTKNLAYQDERNEKALARSRARKASSTND